MLQRNVGGKKKTMKSDKSTTNSAGEEISPNTGCHRGPWEIHRCQQTWRTSEP